MDVPARYGPLTSQLLDNAIADGMGSEDFTRLYRRIDDLLQSVVGEP
jgi:hypothetical protein